MTNNVFYARGDSSSANNSELNAQGTSKQPVVQLEFQPTDGGDLSLDYNSGQPDPDTVVLVDGVEMTFTVEFSGLLPSTNKLSNVNGEDLRGEPIMVITTETGQRFFFLLDGSASFATMDAFPNGAHAIEGVDVTTTASVCFGRGTMIQTPSGEVAIEALTPGTLVSTADGKTANVLWVGCSVHGGNGTALHPSVQPVVIPAHALGAGLPHRDLRVSPPHKILLEGSAVELFAGVSAAFVPAHILADHCGYREKRDRVEYFHVLCDSHAVLVAEGLAAESFQPSRRNLTWLSETARADFSQIFCPDTQNTLCTRPDSHATLRGFEAACVAHMTTPAVKEDVAICA